MAKFFRVDSLLDKQPTEDMLDNVGKILEAKEDALHNDSAQNCLALYNPDKQDYWYYNTQGLTQVIWIGEENTFFSNEKHSEEPQRGKYDREIAPGVWVDVYDVLYAFTVTDPCLQHLIKKALATGVRGHKSTREDLVDIVDSAKRALEHYDAFNLE